MYGIDTNSISNFAKTLALIKGSESLIKFMTFSESRIFEVSTTYLNTNLEIIQKTLEIQNALAVS